MKSENLQFRMLCHQSIDNVSRKRSYSILTANYRELTQLAFMDRVKDYFVAPSTPRSKVDSNADSSGSKSRLLDDTEAIKSVVMSNPGGATTKVVGIETLQKCLDILTDRLDFTVPNSIPVPVPLSDRLRNSVLRRKDFIVTDYDKAIVDKILMVLVSSENLAKQRVGEAMIIEAEEEDQEANMQKEQTSEQEQQKEVRNRVN
jgi:hypothetical protein